MNPAKLDSNLVNKTQYDDRRGLVDTNALRETRAISGLGVFMNVSSILDAGEILVDMSMKAFFKINQQIER